MKTTLGLGALCLLMSPPATAEEPGFQDALLDHFAGKWVLQGTIAGGEVTHDITAEWVVGHQYLRFHEVSAYPPAPFTASRRWPARSQIWKGTAPYNPAISPKRPNTAPWAGLLRDAP